MIPQRMGGVTKGHEDILQGKALFLLNIISAFTRRTTKKWLGRVDSYVLLNQFVIISKHRTVNCQ